MRLSHNPPSNTLPFLPPIHAYLLPSLFCAIILVQGVPHALPLLPPFLFFSSHPLSLLSNCALGISKASMGSLVDWSFECWRKQYCLEIFAKKGNIKAKMVQKYMYPSFINICLSMALPSKGPSRVYVWHVVQWVDRNSDALRLSLRHSNKHTHTHTAVKRHLRVSLHRGSEFLSGRLSLSSRGQSLSKKWTTLVPLQRGHQWRLPRQFVSCMCTLLDKYYKLGRVTAWWLTDVYHPYKLFSSDNIFHVCCVVCIWVI